MAKNTKRKFELQKNVKRLITLVTGFEEGDENFPVCQQYVDSNVKYHRYLSPDSHKIHRTINGLCEKFQVHSQGQKASDLQELTAAFLEQPGLDGKSTGKTDVHYAMLSLLVNLADAPTRVDFKRKQPEVIPEEEDNFDWAGYLLEGEDLNFLSHASSESDDEEPLSGAEDGDKKTDQSQKTLEVSKSTVQVEGESIKGEKVGHSDLSSVVSVTPRGDLSHRALAAVGEGEYEELERTLVVEYWKGKNTEESAAGSHAVCNMYKDWKSYQQRLNPFETFSNKMVVTEPQVVREVLWMLSGVTELFVFHHNGQQFLLNPDLYVFHLTPESLANSLVPLMHRAQQVHALDTFVADIVSQRCSWTSCGPNDNPPLQTYIAFADCISQFLNDFRVELLGLEKLVMKQEANIPLTLLTSKLRPWLQKVEAVHKVILHGITGASRQPSHQGHHLTAASVTFVPDCGDGGGGVSDDAGGGSSNCHKATLLLDTLYDSVYESDLMAEIDGGDMASLMLGMLVRCSRPLLKIVSDWINNGVLHDTASEFVLQRNKDIKSLDETFWEKAFVPSANSTSVADPPSASNFDTKASVDQSSSSGTNTAPSDSHGSVATDRGGGTQSQVLHSADFLVAGGPKLLQPILREAILTGKSMEMLENLGRMREALNVNSDTFTRPPSLYELFVEDLRETLAVFSKQQDKGSPSQSVSRSGDQTTSNVQLIQALSTGSIKQSGKAPEIAKDATIENQLSLPGLKDTLLNINFTALFNNPDSTTGGRRSEPQCPSIAECDLRPLLRLCGGSLYPHVSQRYRTVCSKLVQILKEEYDLMGCIHAMQRYYLMSSGEVMYDFYMPLFSKIENRELWRDCSLLEMFLHDAVEPVFPKDVARLSVEIGGGSKSQQKSVIGATDCIHLKYTVPWPVDVVISGRCQQLYNDVFTFILQIKRAKFTLDQLRFDHLSREQAVPAFARELVSDGGEESVSRISCIHQFHLLRFRLLYFVNSVHNYIMTRILHSTELEFGCQLDAAMDLDQIIHIHSQYVDAVHERCLLHPRLTILRETVLRILNLTLTFGTHWRQGVDFASGKAIQEIDSELSRCIYFLSSFLQNVVKRGSFPHLESLAFALVSSLQFKLTSGQRIS